MEKFQEIIQSSDSNEDKENSINSVFNEVYVRHLSEEDYFEFVNYCLRAIGSPNILNGDSEKEVTRKVLYKLHLHRKNEFNDISLQVISELISPDFNQPVDILAITKELLTIDFLHDVASNEFSDNVLKILQRSRGKLNLATLVSIANVIQLNPKCLPPSKQNQLFCIEIINQISTLSIPSNQFISFMQDVMTVANMVQKIWLTSPGDITLPCLAYIYTLIVVADSSTSNPPSHSLAAFLNVTPKSQIELALKNLLMLASGISNSDSYVVKLATVFCDWLLKWPKATNISYWILTLFKMLTLDGRSSIVAEVISVKATLIIEQSVIPIMRTSTAPVLPYLILTLRDQPQDKIERILKSTISLVTALKASVDTIAQQLRKELVEALYILSDKRFNNEDKLYQSLLSALSDDPRPSEQRLLSRLDAVPALFDPHFSKDCNGPVVLNDNWLGSRTATGKIGLINLGNTCYINSIIQALYMNNDFTSAVLGYTSTSNHQELLIQLQKVLIFLRYSYRAAYSPASFIKASRPPWFETGRQQDCSEFLRYLIDSLYEQERVGRTLLQCDHRWTVGANKEDTDEIENVIELEEEDEATQNNSDLHRWVTEEDLTVGLPSEGTLPVEGGAPVTELSNVHSDSTDSGIQSVGDGQEDKDKPCSISNKQQVNEKQQPSLIHKIFGGIMRTTCRCLACGTESHHQDFFTDLHLAFPDTAAPVSLRATRQTTQSNEGLSLDSLLEFYFTAEKLQGENRYHCDNCAELVQEAERILRVTEAPQHLLLTLLRFHYDRLLQRRGKITTQVSYPQRLTLPIDGGASVSYVLYAVVIHSGVTLDGGHYYTLARNSDMSPEDVSGGDNNTTPWFMFNDSQVSRTDFESLISLSRKYPTDTPYLLWYRRVTDSQDGEPERSTPSPLPVDLKHMVDEDNAKFVQERQRPVNRSLRSNWMPPKKDDDQDGHQGDSFQDNTGSRFIC